VQQVQILFPMVAMATLTFAVGIGLLRARFRAVARGELEAGYFLLNRGARLPRRLIQLEQHYQNLFELPVLYYVLGIVLFASGTATPLQVVLAWSFVALRLFHTVVHTTVNRLRWRMLSFSAGALVLMIAWACFVWTLLR
jgi:hypothetical protein